MFQQRGAHRVSWQLHFGAIPEGLQVCHSCDVHYQPGDVTNRRCVNPRHLWLGDQVMNIADMDAKDRRAKGVVVGVAHLARSVRGAFQGSKNGRAELTDEKVRSIRVAAAAGASYADLGRAFGVTPEAISMAVRRLTWTHVA